MEYGPIVVVSGLKVTVFDEAIIAGRSQTGQGDIIQVQVFDATGTATAEIEENGVSDSGDGVAQLGPFGGGKPAALGQCLFGNAIPNVDVSADSVGLETEGQLVGSAGSDGKGLVCHTVPVALTYQVQAIVAGIGGFLCHGGALVGRPTGSVAALEITVGDERCFCDGDVVQPHHLRLLRACAAEVEEQRLGRVGGGNDKGQLSPLGIAEILGDECVTAVDVVLHVDIHTAGDGFRPDGDGVRFVRLHRHVLRQHTVPVTHAGGGNAVLTGMGRFGGYRRGVKSLPAVGGTAFKVAVDYQIIRRSRNATANGQHAAQKGRTGQNG